MKAELSKLSYNDFLVKTENDKRKAFKELTNSIEWRLPLFPGTSRHEIHEIGFLSDALVSENWAKNNFHALVHPLLGEVFVLS